MRTLQLHNEQPQQEPRSHGGTGMYKSGGTEV